MWWRQVFVFGLFQSSTSRETYSSRVEADTEFHELIHVTGKVVNREYHVVCEERRYQGEVD